MYIHSKRSICFFIAALLFSQISFADCAPEKSCDDNFESKDLLVSLAIIAGVGLGAWYVLSDDEDSLNSLQDNISDRNPNFSFTGNSSIDGKVKLVVNYNW
jgi:hypothetical protein